MTDDSAAMMHPSSIIAHQGASSINHGVNTVH
jgi:hypothetical protein